MVRVKPLNLADVTDEKSARTYERIKEMLGSDMIPEAFLIYGQVPAFLQDFYMNYKKFVHGSGKLDEKTRIIIALAVSGLSGNEFWTNTFIERGKSFGITEEIVAEILAVASTNAMYNTFFKFRSISGTDAFDGLPVGLRRTPSPAHRSMKRRWNSSTSPSAT